MRKLSWLLILFFACTPTILAADEQIKRCIVAIAADVAKISKPQHSTLINTAIDVNAVITKATRERAWRRVSSQAQIWPVVARRVISERTITGLQTYGVETLNSVDQVQVQAFPSGTSFLVRGRFPYNGNQITLSATVRRGGVYGCTVTDAEAFGISISGIVRTAIEQLKATQVR